jgi:putative ABC transport system permease protein
MSASQATHRRDNKYQPPRVAQRFVEWYCKPALSEDLIGDLNEYFERNVRMLGPRRAKLIYIIDALKFVRPYTVRLILCAHQNL